VRLMQGYIRQSGNLSRRIICLYRNHFLTLNGLRQEQRSMFIVSLMEYQGMHSWVKNANQNQELVKPSRNDERKMKSLLYHQLVMKLGLD